MNVPRPVGRPRKLTPETVRKLRRWRPLKELAIELGVSPKTATWIRFNRHKQPSR